MSLPRYQEYKDTGIEWLGEVPAHWNICKIKNTTYLKGRVGWKGLTSDEFLAEGYSYLVTGVDFKNKFINWSDCYRVEKERYEDDPFIQLMNGDLLITKDGTIGKLALVDGLDKPACLNSGIFLIRPINSYITEFMYWVLSSNSFRVFCDLVSQGSTIQHLYQNVFERYMFPLPTLEDQKLISYFLDGETKKIDNLIAEQEKLIELLKEKRQAVISHAVTKGLDPNAKMKDSGVEWFGEVPEHWKIKKVNHLFGAKKGGNAAELTKEFCSTIEGEFPVYSGQTGNDGVMSFIDRYEFDAGDEGYLFSTTVGAKAMTVAHLKGKFSLSQNCMVIIPRSTISYTRFFYYHLQPLFLYERRSIPEHLQPSFRIEDLYSFKVALPPHSEQKHIASFLDDLDGKFSTLIQATIHGIQLLRERRSALISAAVTGQIDVRNAVTNLEAA